MLNEIIDILKDAQDIHWKIQDSDSHSVLFVKVTDKSRPSLKTITQDQYQYLILSEELETDFPNSFVVDEAKWPHLQKELLDKLYPLPDIKLIGITGTNGKTTTTDLVLQIGQQLGKKGLSIGTLGVRECGNTLVDFGLTSPCLIDLRKYLYKYGADKDFCVMEVSSHALVQNRLFGINFDVAGWTSFSQDHLDYHGSMEEYFKAKAMILNHLKEKACLVVPSSEHSFIEKFSHSEMLKKAEVISDTLPLFFSTKFNKDNLEMARQMILEIFPTSHQFDLDSLKAPDGRFYIKEYKTNYIVVDFAHTPDALENICQAIIQAFPQHKLKILFGCGGDRDRSKRSLMGAIAEKYASFIFVTSDNPRSENPDQIIHDIILGFKKNNFVHITDRPTAVEQALLSLQDNEILLLAGKGHEDYILINGIKYPYSDIQTVDNFIAKVNK